MRQELPSNCCRDLNGWLRFRSLLPSWQRPKQVSFWTFGGAERKENQSSIVGETLKTEHPYDTMLHKVRARMIATEEENLRLKAQIETLMLQIDAMKQNKQ